MKKGDKIKVKVGVYAGKEGIIEAIADAPKSIGVGSAITGVVGLITWFKPNEVELINKENKR